MRSEVQILSPRLEATGFTSSSDPVAFVLVVGFAPLTPIPALWYNRDGHLDRAVERRQHGLWRPFLAGDQLCRLMSLSGFLTSLANRPPGTESARRKLYRGLRLPTIERENKDGDLSSISRAQIPGEIGELWDAHGLADHWNETHKV